MTPTDHAQEVLDWQKAQLVTARKLIERYRQRHRKFLSPMLDSEADQFLKETEGAMKTFTVILYDALRFKVEIHIEGINAATLQMGLDGTLGVAGCEIESVEQYVPTDY